MAGHKHKLTVKILDRDEKTFEKLIEKYSRLLWKTAYGILGNSCSETDIEDCISEVFLKLWRNPEKFDYHKSNLKNYLVLLTKSTAIDLYRKKNRFPETNLTDDITTSESIINSFIQKETFRQLEDAILKLNKLEQAVILKRYYEDKKPAEISKELNISTKKIENNLYRAKQKLKQIIKDS